MNAHQNYAFTQLLAAWRRREEARETGSIADLAAARSSLDNARANVQSTMSSQLR